MFDFMTVAKALTDENRVRILMALRAREMCVCQITGFLDLAPSTTSKHLSVLRQARLIESRKKGKWVYYTMADLPSALPVIREALTFVHNALKDSPEILQDRHRIEAILAREADFCSEMERRNTPDSYHSLEIHTLADDNTTATE